MPYEILPSWNGLINTTVGSGFPADRFCIQYFPEDIAKMLTSRKRMKITISVIVKK